MTRSLQAAFKVGDVLSKTAAVAAAAIGATTGSVVSQGIGLITGIQDRFDWRGVALSAISAGVSGGLGGVGDGFIAGAVRGIQTNVISQGIGLATGLQKRFDWTAVAAGAVVGGVSNSVSSWAALGKSDSFINQAVTSGAGAIAGAATRSLLTGTDFGDNVLAVLPDVIASTIGNTIGAKVQFGKAASRQGQSANGSEGVLEDNTRSTATLANENPQGLLKPLPPLGDWSGNSQGSSGANLDDARDYIRSLDTSWILRPPTSLKALPKIINLSYLEKSTQSLMDQSYPGGRDMEQGGTLYSGDGKRLILERVGGKPFGVVTGGMFQPDLRPLPSLKSVTLGLKALGEFHTHPYNKTEDGADYSVTFSGQDIGQFLNAKLNVSIVRGNNGNQWMLMRTEKTPSTKVDPILMQENANTRKDKLVGMGYSFPDAQSKIVTEYAQKYNLGYYESRNGIFKRVFPR